MYSVGIHLNIMSVKSTTLTFWTQLHNTMIFCTLKPPLFRCSYFTYIMKKQKIMLHMEVGGKLSKNYITNKLPPREHNIYRSTAIIVQKLAAPEFGHRELSRAYLYVRLYRLIPAIPIRIYLFIIIRSQTIINIIIMRCFGAINNGRCRLVYSHRRLCARIGIVSLVVLYAKRLFIRRNVLRSVGWSVGREKVPPSSSLSSSP